MKYLSFFLVFLLFFLSLSVSAYYSPGKPQGFVNDYANMLSPELRQEIEMKLVQFEKETSNEIAIVTLEILKGDTIENFSVKLLEEYGVGKKDKNNGILILISKDDRQMRIEVGYGLEGALTDAQSYWIIENIMKPAFRTGDYGAGINQAVDKIIETIKGEYIIPSNKQISVNSEIFFKSIFVVVMFIFPFFASILSRSKSWWLGGIIGFLIGLISIFIFSLISGIVITVILTLFGLLFDYLVSKEYHKAKRLGRSPHWWAGGRGFGGGFRSGSGFRGFGGGLSGGGGSSGRW